MAKRTRKKIPPKFWVTCSNGEARHPRKFGYDPKDIKSYILRLKEGYEAEGKTFTGVLSMLDHAQDEVEKMGS